jgi:threonylcarbamoyladenosine tRNA methylthiotransferase MtaB
MSLRVAFHTLGCKLNQLETESIADAFARSGATIGAEAAELVIVNTCTVTGKAEQKARRIIRLALAADPDAVVIVTGCYAQVEGEALSSLGERVLVLPGSGKDRLLGLPAFLEAAGRRGLLEALRGWLERPDAAQRVLASAEGGAGRFAFNPEVFAFHSRPALKVQDGCDNACAYCRVHIARGRSSSLPVAAVVGRARALEAAGRAEIVLSGVNLAQYRDGELGFPGLLRALLAGTERVAFRLSSYEPDAIDQDFLEVFAHPRVRPHAHLALQSGSDAVLAAMGRHYGREDAIDAVKALRSSGRDPFIGADLIAGFPGETEADARQTLELARACDFAWIHAFPFSPRPGTRAAVMGDRVPERVAGERVDALLELGAAGRSSYIARSEGRVLKAVIEKDFCATTENYLKATLCNLPDSLRPGNEVLCTIGQHGKSEHLSNIDVFALYIGASRP